MSGANFDSLREHLRGLSLHEVDFTVGDAFVSRLGDLKQAILQVDTKSEPWVAQWLAAEHYKAGLLWTGAKVNWSKEQTEGAHGAFNAQTRVDLIGRFNRWASHLQARLAAYERSGRTSDDVATWQAELERFRQDPVNNP